MVAQCRVNTACDTSFFFWHRNLLPRHLQQLYSIPTEAYRLPYVIAALKDSMVVARRAQDATGEPIATQLHEEVMAELQANVIQPLCQAIEEDLRYQTLTEVVTQRDQQARNPLQANVADLTHLFKLRPFKFNGETINISSEVRWGWCRLHARGRACRCCVYSLLAWRVGQSYGCALTGLVAQVAHYLDTTFYNLTTVSLSNWHIYARMKSLAELKYGLVLQETHLPSQTLEQVCRAT